MNHDNCCAKTRTSIYVIGVLGTFLLVAGLVALMRHYAPATPLTQARVDERMKNLADLKAVNAPILEKYDWQDKNKNIVRIPIERAKELVLEEWKNPSLAHSNLMARAAKAFAVAPPPPSPYE